MPVKDFFKKTTIDPSSKKPVSKPDPIKIALLSIAGILFLVVSIGLINLTFRALRPAPKKSLPETNSTKTIELEKQRQLEASKSAAERATPKAKLAKAYQDIVGSTDFLRDVSFENGLGTIRYTINSKDNKTILTTGYQNFADFASSVFDSITQLEKLRLIIYATGIVDSQGQSNTAAMTLQISRTKNDQINWQVNKFRYETYPINLEVNTINSLLDKDYQKLIKKTQ